MGRSDARVLCGQCPDTECSKSLFFPAQQLSVECTACGQRHARSALQNVAEVTNSSVALHNMLKNLILGNMKNKKGTDSVKVLGLSNYHCKLVSPLLTKYGMDKHTGKAVLLKDMGQGEYFDCGVLGHRAFLIESNHIGTVGYGKDIPGAKYLEHTLEAIKKANGGQETLVPIHADGDGHCLVHAVSRALVGRELFWHALRENLKSHLSNNLENYKLLFKDFIGADEWEVIIQECDPDFTPPEGEQIGLRNIHIFGLANLLKRPIILLDSIHGLQSSGDYSGKTRQTKCCCVGALPCTHGHTRRYRAVITSYLQTSSQCYHAPTLAQTSKHAQTSKQITENLQTASLFITSSVYNQISQPTTPSCFHSSFRNPNYF